MMEQVFRENEHECVPLSVGVCVCVCVSVFGIILCHGRVELELAASLAALGNSEPGRRGRERRHGIVSATLPPLETKGPLLLR